MGRGILIVVMLWHCLALTAQTGTVAGHVFDGTSNEPLTGANVFVSLTQGTTTDGTGHFELELSAGEYNLTISFTGYEKLIMPVTVRDGIRMDIAPILLKRSGTLLEQLVITSGRYEQALGKVTVSMDVLPASMLERLNNTSLDQALERMPAVTIIDGQPNIRGGSGYSYGAGSRVLMLLDDMPILTGDAGFPIWGFLPLEHVGQVEVIKGASSVLYGSSALNGIINLRTAWPSEKPETHISSFSGMYLKPTGNLTTIPDRVVQGDTFYKQKAWWDAQSPFYTGLELSHRQRMGRTDLIVGGFLFSEDSHLQNEYDRRVRMSWHTRHRFRNHRWTAGLNGNMQWHRSSSFFMWQDHYANAYRPLANTMTRNHGFRMNIDPSLQYVGPKGMRHRIQGRYFRNENGTDMAQSTISDLLFGEYQALWPIEDMKLHLMGGITGSYIHTLAELYGDTTHTAGNQAAYVQAEKELGRLNLVAGFRMERNRINDKPHEWQPVKRLGANFRAGVATYLRASFGQGYRYPTIAERYVETNVGLISIFPNPELQSERGYSAEVGIKQGFAVGQWKGYADGAVFLNRYENMMEFSFGGEDGTLFGFQSINVGGTDIRGFEVTLNGTGEIGPVPLTLVAGYNYIEPRYTEWDSVKQFYSSADYNVLKYRFRHTFTGTVQASWKRFDLTLHTRYYSRMEAVDYVFEVLIPGVAAWREAQGPGDWVADAEAGMRLGERTVLSVFVRNAFNREYTLRPAMMEATRNVGLRVKVKV